MFGHSITANLCPKILLGHSKGALVETVKVSVTFKLQTSLYILPYKYTYIKGWDAVGDPPDTLKLMNLIFHDPVWARRTLIYILTSTLLNSDFGKWLVA